MIIQEKDSSISVTMSNVSLEILAVIWCHAYEILLVHS